MRKSSLAVEGLTLAVIFIGVYTLCYYLMIEPLYELMPEAPLFVHSAIISAVGTIPCMLGFLLSEKRLVPAAYAFLAAFMAFSYLLCFVHFHGEERVIVLFFVNSFVLGPVLIGGASAVALYLLLRRRDRSLRK